jgi:hypothetical protein
MTETAAAHHCTNPQRTRIENQRTELNRVLKTPEWIEASTAYKARHPPVCSRCGCEGPIVPGHCAEDYKDMATYIQKVRLDQVVPLCWKCNKKESQGLHPCPACVEKHRDDPAHPIRYIAQGKETCSRCEGWPAKNVRLRYRIRHPCGNRAGQQRCLRDGRVFICAWTAKKCRGCEHFREREVRT